MAVRGISFDSEWRIKVRVAHDLFRDQGVAQDLKGMSVLLCQNSLDVISCKIREAAHNVVALDKLAVIAGESKESPQLLGICGGFP